ncbi:MAG TPA: hypothetical protein VLF79_03420 [Candidatus Saccharimonadales bacterium]|nr:hypothetical protein [Candidatus Saccharimonadales bacterium]
MASKKSSKKSFFNKKQTFTNAQVLVFILIFVLVGIVAIWHSSAAPINKGGGKPSGGGSISLILPPDIDKNSDGLPNFGDTVSFNESTTATEQPFVNVKCYQNGASVYNSWRGLFPAALDYPNRSFSLSSGAWQSGGANCTATLGYYVKNGAFKVAASTDFTVNP